MARHTKEWNEGYQAAIEAIKKAMQGGGSGSGEGDGEGLPSDMTPPPSQGGSGSGSSSKNKSNNQGGSGEGNSRTNENDPSQGIVRPEDCEGSSGVDDMPGTPGGFFSKEDGDKLAEKEGYGKEGGSDEQLEKNWAEQALKAASQMKGDAAGKFKALLEGLYKTRTDWKAALRRIVGRSINPDDKMQAFANKNVLVSQGRIARTDKDKFDNMDYLIALVDSSGSMSDDQLKMVLSEVYSVAVAKKPMSLVVIQCDTAIQEIKIYKDVNELKKDIIHASVKGRGGTDFAAFWNLLKTDKRFKNHKSDLIMIFTDGYVSQLKRDRKIMNNLIWCIIDNPSFNLKHVDSQTKTIHINSKDIK